MLLVIIAIVCLIGALILMCGFKNPLGVFVVLLALLFGGLGVSDISGYEEPTLQKEFELKAIYDPNTYIIEDSDGSVTCKHIITSEHPEAIESYGKYTYNGNVEIVVTEKGSKPVMKEYLEKARKTIWTFALDCNKTKYVFYVPEETIERWQNVHVN